MSEVSLRLEVSRKGTEMSNGYTIQELEEKLSYYVQMKDDLANGLITPRKVVGTGYKNARKVANEWLDGVIAETKVAIGEKKLAEFYASKN